MQQKKIYRNFSPCPAARILQQRFETASECCALPMKYTQTSACLAAMDENGTDIYSNVRSTEQI